MMFLFRYSSACTFTSALCILLLNLIWPAYLSADETSVTDNDKMLIAQIDSLNYLSRELTFINPTKSLELAQIALSMSENYERGKAFAYRNIANINVINEVYSLGAQYINMAFEIFSELEDSVGMADCYISYGHMYRGLQDITNQISYFEKAYTIYSHLNFSDRQGVCAFNLAESYFFNHQYDESRELVNEAVALNTKAGQSQVLSACYKLLGMLELKEGKSENAAGYFNKVLEFTQVLGENSQKIATIESLVQLAELAEANGNSEKQKLHLITALEYAVQNGLSTYIISTYNKLLLFHLKNNETEAARALLYELNMKSDSISKNRIKDQGELVNSLINAYNLEKENRYLELINRLQQKNLKVIKISMMIILLIAFVILLISFNLNRVKMKVKQQYQELQRRNELITIQKKELDELLANRDRLFSIIAHDLRNPFNSILLTLELMAMGMERNNFDRMKSDLLRLSNTARSTYELLEKLLLWAKTQKENVQPDKVELMLYDEVNEALLSLTGQAQLKNILVTNEVSSGTIVFADKNMLQTILRNLIQNAIKFTRPDGEVQVVAETKAKSVVTSVRDNGVGMDKPTARHLFDIDKSKIRNGTTGETGSGLGLVLCRQFVEKNEGSIWAESEPDQGTTISFTLLKPVLKIE